MAKGLAGNYGVRTETHPGRVAKRDDGGAGGAVVSDYQQIGDTSMYRTPDRMMHVGTASGAERYPPQSEQEGRGTLVPSWEEQFLAEHPYPEMTGSYGPVAEIVNDQQFTPS